MKLWAVVDKRGRINVATITKSRYLSWNEACWLADPRQKFVLEIKPRLKRLGYSCKRINVTVDEVK